MNAFNKRIESLENELDKLREELFVADAKYENAICISELHAADLECKRLRAEIQATQQQLCTFNEELIKGSNPTKPTEFPKKKTQTAGK